MGMGWGRGGVWGWGWGGGGVWGYGGVRVRAFGSPRRITGNLVLQRPWALGHESWVLGPATWGLGVLRWGLRPGLGNSDPEGPGT